MTSQAPAATPFTRTVAAAAGRPPRDEEDEADDELGGGGEHEQPGQGGVLGVHSGDGGVDGAGAE